PQHLHRQLPLPPPLLRRHPDPPHPPRGPLGRLHPPLRPNLLGRLRAPGRLHPRLRALRAGRVHRLALHGPHAARRRPGDPQAVLGVRGAAGGAGARVPGVRGDGHPAAAAEERGEQVPPAVLGAAAEGAAGVFELRVIEPGVRGESGVEGLHLLV
ncbi:hypothetical protein LTR53_007726, partial [Teratosphaeriaceae sp. CCFEE 6253]